MTIRSMPANWKIARNGGPVLATAVHAGNRLRDEYKPYLHASADELRREEDPLTDIWAGTGDDVFSCYTSRFEVDLNRSRERAFATRPEQTWGLRVWREAPPAALIEQSLEQHDLFYQMMSEWIENLIAAHGSVLLLDIHSYNHCRDGRGQPAPAENNPDIDLGLTELDRAKFGNLVDTFTETLRAGKCQNKNLDVRANVRYPDGGHWPEWVYAEYGANVCTITLEYKKFYMDEWTHQADLPVVEDLRFILSEAVAAARKELVLCR